jgi:hypothetical protein
MMQLLRLGIELVFIVERRHAPRVKKRLRSSEVLIKPVTSHAQLDANSSRKKHQEQS